MKRHVARRMVSVLLSLAVISVVTFLFIRLIPGDPVDVMYGVDRPDPEARAAVEERLGLDQPIWVQYARWVTRSLTGDLGFSYRSQLPVRTIIGQRLPATLALTVAGLILAIAFAIPLGVLTATRRDSWIDLGGMAVALLFISVPPFISALLFVGLFALTLGWLPVMGVPRTADVGAWLQHMAMPAVVLAATLAGILVRLTRSSVLEELGRDYVRTARSKGLPGRVVLTRHALKNALLPVTTLVGLQIGYLLGGAIIVESVFAWPGIGSLVVSSILDRDYPTVQAVVLLIASLVVVVSLLVDITYSLLDPRVRLT
jgi:peptide/nickel transport system permease protein